MNSFFGLDKIWAKIGSRVLVYWTCHDYNICTLLVAYHYLDGSIKYDNSKSVSSVILFIK